MPTTWRRQGAGTPNCWPLSRTTPSPTRPRRRRTSSFRVGEDQDELGFIDRKYAPGGASATPGGAVMFWHVDDLPATLEQLLAMGATEYEPLTTRDSGFTTASVIDPFGNILGVMHNPHYLEVLARRSAS